MKMAVIDLCCKVTASGAKGKSPHSATEEEKRDFLFLSSPLTQNSLSPSLPFLGPTLDPAFLCAPAVLLRVYQ